MPPTPNGDRPTATIDLYDREHGSSTPGDESLAVRKMTVRMPGPEQLAVWQRTAKRMAGVDPDSVDGTTAMKLLDRGLRFIQSVLVHEADRDWLEDQLLDGNLTLEEAARIVTLAMDAFADTKPAGKPAPAKRARRATR